MSRRATDFMPEFLKPVAQTVIAGVILAILSAILTGLFFIYNGITFSNREIVKISEQNRSFADRLEDHEKRLLRLEFYRTIGTNDDQRNR